MMDGFHIEIEHDGPSVILTWHSATGVSREVFTNIESAIDRALSLSEDWGIPILIHPRP